MRRLFKALRSRASDVRGSVSAKFLTVCAIVGGVLVVAVPAYADASADMAPIGTAASTVKDDILNVAGQVLPYAAAILAIVLGWKFARRFLRAA